MTISRLSVYACILCMCMTFFLSEYVACLYAIG